jgi:AraC-like DNA-binding protein
MISDYTQEMAEMYAQGYSLSDIAAKFGTSRQRVHQLIADTYDRPHGGRLRKQRYEERVLAAHSRIHEGVTTAAEEAEDMGIQEVALRAALSRRNLRLPPKRPPSPLHGSYYRYQEGCRCDECRAAQKAYMKKLQERGPREHGTESAYRNYKCRCDECRAAGSAANRRYRQGWKERKRLALPAD